jgi:hypothetical protein
MCLNQELKFNASFIKCNSMNLVRMIADYRNISCWLFELMSLYAFAHNQMVNGIAFQVLFIFSYANHNKILKWKVIHYIDTIYAHLFATQYILGSIYMFYKTRNAYFTSSFVNAGLISIYIYKTNHFPKSFVHIFVFIGGMSYIMGTFEST